MCVIAQVCVGLLAVVSFKDSAKIKSWDAWDDHKAPVAWTEKRSSVRGWFSLRPRRRTAGCAEDLQMIQCCILQGCIMQ